MRSFPARALLAPSVVTLAAGTLFLFHLGVGALRDWDEAIYAEVSRQMILTRDWITPHWQLQAFFEKPPLLFWLQATFFRIFQASEFWARFPSALSGIAAVLLTFLITRRLSASTTAAYIAAAALLTSRNFINLARMGMCDAPLLAAILLVLYAWLRLRSGSIRWLFVISFATAAGAMIKGPAILVAPAAFAFDLHYTRRDARPHISGLQWTLALLLALALVLPWHIAMLFMHGRPFFNQYLLYQIGERATHTLDASGGSLFFYLHILVTGAFPWSLIAILSLLNHLRLRKRPNVLLWSLAAITFFLYSLVATKHGWYIAPVYPALAVESGCFLANLISRRHILRFAIASALALGLVITFYKLANRTGDSLANQMAQLAALARPAPGTLPAIPLFVITRSGSDPQPDTPTAAFYSHRPVRQFVLPADLDTLTASLPAHSTAVILDNSALPLLQNRFVVHPVAANSLLTCAVLTPTQSF